MGDRFYRAVVRLTRGVHRVLGLRFDIRGVEHIPGSGAAVLAVNHIGYLDFTFAGLAADGAGRLVRFLAKRSAFRNVVTGPAMRAMGHIPVDRQHGEHAYHEARDALQAGEIVGVFPEATISRSWLLKPFKRGAAALAVNAQVPLIPVITWGGHRVLTVDRHFHLRRGVAVTILVGEPILPSPFTPPRTDAVEVVNEQLHRQMTTMLDRAQRTYPQSPRDAADRWWLPRSLGGTAPTPADAALLDSAALAGTDAAPVPVRPTTDDRRPH